MSSDTEKGSKNVKVDDSEVKTKDKQYKSGEKGGKPGSAPGAENNTGLVNKGKAAYSFYEMDVKFEGKDCARLLELPPSPFGWQAIPDPIPLQQTADGKTQVECAGKLHDTTVLPAPAPSVTYVDPPPFPTTFVVPYRSGRIPTPEEVAAYRADPQAADAQDEKDIEAASIIQAQEQAKQYQLTAGFRAAVDAKIDAYNAVNPEYDNLPITGIKQSTGLDGLYKGQIFVRYGNNITDIWEQEFSLQGDPIGRPKRTPEGNVLQARQAYSTDPVRDRFVDRTDLTAGHYTAKVVFPDGGGYYLFNEKGEAYWGEIYDVETGNRTRGVFAENKFPALSDRGAPLVQTDYVQLAKTECPVPCQAVTDVYNAIASEMNLIIREMNQLAEDHTAANAAAQAQEANYEAYLRAEAAANPLTGPDPGDPAPISVNADRERYESLRDMLLEFEPKLATAKRNLEACQCPGTVPSPLLAADGQPYQLPTERWPIKEDAFGTPADDAYSEETNHASGESIYHSWHVAEDASTNFDVVVRIDEFETLRPPPDTSASYPIGSASMGLVPLEPTLKFDSDQSKVYEKASPRYIQSLPDQDAQRWAIERVLGTARSTDQAGKDRAQSTLVAVIDTGVDMQHPSLLGRIWTNPNEIPGNGIDDDGNGLVDDLNGWNFVTDSDDVRDTNGHGTLVAGLVAASGAGGDIEGINPNAQIMALKVANYAGKGNSIDIGSAVTYAVNNGARVINISLGGDQFSEAEGSAVDYALEKGALVVVASGNQGSDAAAFWPAALPGVITVAATTREDARANYSNWGTVVDIAAPGSEVVSLRARYTDPMMFGEGEGEYEPFSNVVGENGRQYLATGTSFAAPLVSGAASLLWADNPNLANADVQRMLLHSARDLETPGPDILTGYGLLDVSAALQAEPEFFIDARIANVQVVQRDGKPSLQLLGTADADKFKGASVKYGAGEAPASWREAGKIKAAVRDGVLAEIGADKLSAEARWTVQLVVEHKNGDTRLAQFDLKLR